MAVEEDRSRGPGPIHPIGPLRPEAVVAPTLRVVDLGRIEYGRALRMQEELLAQRIAGEIGDTLLLLEHEHVFTLGRGADEADLLGAPERLGVPVFRVGRGGGVTYHGPGQLVAYPIVGVARAGRDVRRYVRGLEQALIATCARYGVTASGKEDCTGVWVGNEKIASIGVGVRRWVAYHGIALNVSTDLSHFAAVVPCRVPSMRLTNLDACAGRTLDLAEVARAFAESFGEQFGYGAMERGSECGGVDAARPALYGGDMPKDQPPLPRIPRA